MGVSPQIWLTVSSTHDLLFGTFGNDWQSLMKISTKENSNSPKNESFLESSWRVQSKASGPNLCCIGASSHMMTPVWSRISWRWEFFLILQVESSWQGIGILTHECAVHPPSSSTGGRVIPCLWAQWWSRFVICRWWRCSCSYSGTQSCSGVFGGWYLRNITMIVWHRNNHNIYWCGAQNTELVIVVWDFKANRILGLGW